MHHKSSCMGRLNSTWVKHPSMGWNIIFKWVTRRGLEKIQISVSDFGGCINKPEVQEESEKHLHVQDFFHMQYMKYGHIAHVILEYHGFAKKTPENIKVIPKSAGASNRTVPIKNNWRSTLKAWPKPTTTLSLTSRKSSSSRLPLDKEKR